MKTYILMSKLAPHGPSLIEIASKVKEGSEVGRKWVEEVMNHCPEVKFKAHYALLGGYDFMDIYEAPDEIAAAEVSMICGSDGIFVAESWTAIPEKRIAEIARRVIRPEFNPEHQTGA
ncbi:MAG: GYD domain-containing protein [bacterium]